MDYYCLLAQIFKSVTVFSLAVVVNMIMCWNCFKKKEDEKDGEEEDEKPNNGGYYFMCAV